MAGYVLGHSPITLSGSLLLTCRSDKQTKQYVIVKTAPDFLFLNERDILKRFQTI